MFACLLHYYSRMDSSDALNMKVMATGHCRVLGCGESKSELTERHSDQSGAGLRISEGGGAWLAIQL